MTHIQMLKLALYMGLNLDASQFFLSENILGFLGSPSTTQLPSTVREESTRNPNKQV